MRLDDLLRQFGQDKGLVLKTDLGGRCRIKVNNEFVITFENALGGRGFFLYSVVLEVPPEKEHACCLMALEGNLFYKETGQTSLGYFSPSKSLILFQYFKEGAIDYPEFEKQLDKFMQYFAFWKNKVDQISESSEEALNKQLPKWSTETKVFFA